MNAVSRERFVPFDADADAVSPTQYLPATAEGLHPTYSIRTSMAVPSVRWLAAPPTRNECSVYRLSSIPAARRWVWRFKVICNGVYAKFPLPPLSRTLGNRKPEPATSSHSMDAAACRYFIMDTTAQISRQFSLIFTTTAWDDSRNVFLNKKLKMKPSRRDICNTCVTTAPDRLNPRFIVRK